MTSWLALAWLLDQLVGWLVLTAEKAREVVELYEGGHSIQEASGKANVPYQRARQAIGAAGVPIRGRHSRGEGTAPDGGGA